MSLTAPQQRTLGVLGLAALIPATSQTILIPSLPLVTREYAATPDGVVWLLTGYLIMAAVSAPVLGRLGDLYGRRPMILVGLGMFLGGAVICLAATSLPALVLGRAIQGGGAGVFILALATVQEVFPRSSRATSIGLLSVLVGIGPGCGFLAGGLLVDLIGVRAIFCAAVLGTGLVAVLAWLWVPATGGDSKGRMDLPGTVGLVVAVAVPLAAISQGNTWGWTSGRVLGLLGLGVILCAAWVWLERRTTDPLVDLSALRIPTVGLANLATLLVGAALMGLFVITPQLVQEAASTDFGLGYGAIAAGLVLVPGALAMLIAGPTSARIGARVGDRVPLAVGGLITAVGLAAIAYLHSSVALIVGFSLLASIGIGFAFPAMPSLVMAAVPPSEIGQAAGVNSLLRGLGSAIGAQLCVALVAGTVVAGSTVPTDGGYRLAYLAAGAAALLAAGVALLIPGTPGGRPHAPATPDGIHALGLPEALVAGAPARTFEA